MKKMGRPKADKPKEIKYSVRTDAETERRLAAYCTAHGISKGEAYRRGINLLLKAGNHGSCSSTDLQPDIQDKTWRHYTQGGLDKL